MGTGSVKGDSMKEIPAEEIAREEKEEGVVRVCVAIPTEGHAHVEAYANRLCNFMALGKLESRGKYLKETPRFEFFFVTLGRIFTPLAREEAAKQSLAANMDYLFMIDDDMICPDDLFERLYKHNVDLVAPLAFTRNYPHRAVLYSIKEGYDPASKSPYFFNHWIDNYPKDTLVRCDAVGFGAVLIKMDVIRKMAEPRFMSSAATGEDILFCHKAGKLGFKIYMDTSTKLGHLSHPLQITEEYVTNIHKTTKYNAAEGKKEYDKYEPLLLVGERYN